MRAEPRGKDGEQQAAGWRERLEGTLLLPREYILKILVTRIKKELCNYVW